MTDQHSAPKRSRIEQYSSRRQEALIRLLQAADVARRRLANAIEPHGVTFQQYNVLRILRGAREPLPILEIGQRMMEETPGITRLIDRLEAKSLVARERSLRDRRVCNVSITAKGLALLKSMDAMIDEADDLGIGDLTVLEVDQLISLLKTVVERPKV